MELHDVGPAKLFDTAGVDEEGELGAKKLAKTLAALKECDVAVVVVDLARVQALAGAQGLEGALQWELLLLGTAAKYQVRLGVMAAAAGGFCTLFSIVRSIHHFTALLPPLHGLVAVG